MLRRRVARLSNLPSVPVPPARARALLDEAAERVLGADGATEIRWRAKDRTIADRVRIEIGQVLEPLQRIGNESATMISSARRFC